MRSRSARFIMAVATLVGTTIGVGIFGVPYALSRAGIVAGICFLVGLAAIQMMQNLYLAEAAIAAPEKLRLVGLVRKYLGPAASWFASVSTILGFWGAMLAYIIVGGTFLHTLLSGFLGGSEWHYQLAWAMVSAFLLFFDLNILATFNAGVAMALVVTLIAVIARSLPFVRLGSFAAVHAPDWFFPYGVILFALGGLAAITEMEDIIGSDRALYRRAIITGSVVAASLIAAFGLVVWGVSGAATSPDAVQGLALRIGGNIAWLASLCGFFAVMSAYTAVGLNVRSIFHYDFRLPRLAAWLCAVGAPILVFAFGFVNFVRIIAFSGAVFGGMTSAFVCALYIVVTRQRRVRKERLGVPAYFAYVSLVVLLLGAGIAIWRAVQAL